MNKWYYQSNKYNDVVVSSRIRLARNLKDYCFQERMKAEDSERLVKQLRDLTTELSAKEGMEYYSCNVNKLSSLDKTSLVEWHTISPALMRKEQDTGLILSEDESISIMINEEDHIRIQAVTGGCDIRGAFRAANRIDDFLDSKLVYAYDDRYGYLTSCPTNTGTGLRASYMMSLPALTMAGKAEALAEEVGKFGVVIRGIYGEGTKSVGYLYQVSNQKTLGISEQEIIDRLDQIVEQIISQERKCRELLIKSQGDDIEDKIYRSYGVLKYAKQLTAKDAMLLLAQVKLGSDTGILKLKGDGSNIHRLMLEIQPSNLQKRFKRSLGNGERDKLRAEYINEKLPFLAE